MSKNTIKFIIDYKGYGMWFDLINTRSGELTNLLREEAMDYVTDNQFRTDNNIQVDTFFSAKADVALRSVPQKLIS
tara:strand:- start:334 stop:561 length:228 start_codon:yes stop_codon:yes gene_type:complete